MTKNSYSLLQLYLPALYELAFALESQGHTELYKLMAEFCTKADLSLENINGEDGHADTNSMELAG